MVVLWRPSSITNLSLSMVVTKQEHWSLISLHHLHCFFPTALLTLGVSSTQVIKTSFTTEIFLSIWSSPFSYCLKRTPQFFTTEIITSFTCAYTALHQQQKLHSFDCLHNIWGDSASTCHETTPEETQWVPCQEQANLPPARLSSSLRGPPTLPSKHITLLRAKLYFSKWSGNNS